VTTGLTLWEVLLTTVAKLPATLPLGAEHRARTDARHPSTFTQSALTSLDWRTSCYDKGMRICIAEPNVIVAATLQEFLSKLGHQITTFRQASRLLHAPIPHDLRIDLLLVDLPDRTDTSSSLLRALHNRFPESDIIAATGGENGIATEEATRSGVFAFLRKPVRLAELELMLLRVEERRCTSELRKLQNSGLNAHDSDAAHTQACPCDGAPDAPRCPWAQREFVRLPGYGQVSVAPAPTTQADSAQPHLPMPSTGWKT